MSALRSSLLSYLGVLLIVSPRSGHSAPPSKKSSAQDRVRLALKQEVHGNAALRHQLLLQALKKDADYAPARWHLGQLEYGGQWRNYQAIPGLEAKRPEVRKYRKLRQALPNQPDNAVDQLELADWCRDHDLPLREKAHLIAALELSKNPNNVKLRARLGHQFVNGAWMTPKELAENRETAKRIEAAAKIWRPRLKILKRQLQSPRTELQEKAKQELLAVDDPDVLPVLEAAFSKGSLGTAEVYVDVLSQMKLVEADRFLARQAVLSPYVTVRETAAKALRSQPPESYAPVLLEALHTPIQSRVGLFVGRSGVRLTHLIASETQDVRQIAGRDSQVVTRNILMPVLINGRGDRGLGNLPERASKIEVLKKQLQAYAQQRAVDLKNTQLKERNDRIFTALEIATGLDLPNDPADWWTWWEDYNQLFSPDKKPVEYVIVTEVREKIVRHPIPIPFPGERKSCLTAGTPVWTDRGFVPVENVQVGTLVLSKHPQTGELTYKPVLKTTVRPPADVVTARFANSEITCTLGHTFWISGKGWQKIRGLPKGSLFHTASGAAKMETLEKAQPSPTYNLVVADFHTYFVGRDMLLSHDPTFAEPLNNPVPGWPE